MGDNGAKEVQGNEAVVVAGLESFKTLLKTRGFESDNPAKLLATVRAVMGSDEADKLVFYPGVSGDRIFDESLTPNDKRFLIDRGFTDALAKRGVRFLPPPSLVVEGGKAVGVRLGFSDSRGGGRLIERWVTLITSDEAPAKQDWSTVRGVGKLAASYSARVTEPTSEGLKQLLTQVLVGGAIAEGVGSAAD